MIKHYNDYENLVSTLNALKKGKYEYPKFEHFIIISKLGVKHPGFSYKSSDLEKASPKFKKCLKEYNSIVTSEDCTEGPTLKIATITKKLAKMEKIEGIKRYSSKEENEFLSEFLENQKRCNKAL